MISRIAFRSLALAAFVGAALPAGCGSDTPADGPAGSGGASGGTGGAQANTGGTVSTGGNPSSGGTSGGQSGGQTGTGGVTVPGSGGSAVSTGGGGSGGVPASGGAPGTGDGRPDAGTVTGTGGGTTDGGPPPTGKITVAPANTLTVTSTADNTTGPGCTLRMAVAAANSGSSNACGHGTGNNDTIQIGISGAVTIALNPRLGPLQVTRSMTIQGNFNGQAPNYTTVTVSTTSGSIITMPSSTNTPVFSTLVLQWLRLTGGNAGSGNGGCLALNAGQAYLNVVQIDHCRANGGGAIYANAGGVVALNRSYIHDNTAAFGGAVDLLDDGDGGIGSEASTFYNNHATNSGGAIYGNDTHMELHDTTVNGNSATTDGGGIYAVASDGVLMNNTTIANNVATHGHGGGIYIQGPGYWQVSNITMAHNSAGTAGGGLYMAGIPGGPIEDGDNIFAYNTAPQGPDVSGNAQFFATAPDIITNASGNTPPMGGFYGPWIVADPQLGSLQSIGGLPAVYPLLPNSPAIDAGGSDVSYDQRGMCRSQGSNPDIGAFEYSPSSTYIITSVNSGMVLDDPGSSRTAGTQMDQWSLNNGLNQQWQLSWHLEGGPVQLVNQASLLTLGVRGGSTTAGAAVEQETAPSEMVASQSWWLAPSGVGTGYFTFTNVNSNLLMDVVAASKSAGARIDQWSSNNNANQKWTFSVNPTTPLCPQFVAGTTFSNPI